MSTYHPSTYNMFVSRTSLKLTCLLVHLRLAYGDFCMSRVLMLACTAHSLIAPYSWQRNSWTCLHHYHHVSCHLSCSTTRHVSPRMPAIRTNQLLRYRYSTVHCSFKPHTETYPQTNACNYNRTTHYVTLMEQPMTHPALKSPHTRSSWPEYRLCQQPWRVPYTMSWVFSAEYLPIINKI